ncbi:flavodoxin-dependent (E)-4-hydroxy-3-methylbut-2-enyl-diphosphate synthase [Thermoproteota archaeon]
MQSILRRITPSVQIKDLFIGSDHPIAIQSMTNTPTSDIKATVSQIQDLFDSGSEMVRLTINDDKAMKAVPEIVSRLEEKGYNVPLIGDFHYNGHLLLSKFSESASLLDKFRINPGNVGKGKRHDENFNTIIRIAIDLNKPVRIGANWGSIDQELFSQIKEDNGHKKDITLKKIMIKTMVKSTLNSVEQALKLGLSKSKLVLSAKMSDVQDTITVYQELAAKCDNVLHVGLTEAGSGLKGITASAAGIGILLQQGIGDTIRVSLTPEPGAPRSLEVKVCQEILQTMNFRCFKPTITSCPGCGRTNSDAYLTLAKAINDFIDAHIQEWKVTYPGIERLHIAVMGCVVNGPGESKFADIGICFPGISETPVCPVYIKGERAAVLNGATIKEQFLKILIKFIQSEFKPYS